MMSDISRKAMQLGAARTPCGSRFVLFAPASSSRLARADVVLLRNAEGHVVPGRFIGMVMVDTDEPDVYEQVELLRIRRDGIPLDNMLNDVSTESARSSGSHVWGAIGLPDGPATRVRPLDDEASSADDVTIARASAGHQQYLSDRVLSVTPGDVVHAAGTEARVVAVDRRKGTIEIEVGQEVREVALDDIDDLETYT